MIEFLYKNWYVDKNEADLLVCVIKFIEIGQEMPELANRSDLSPVPICHRDQYCKRGYFAGGKFLRKCWQHISRGGNFHDNTPISFIKAHGFYFRVGVIFTKKTKARKTR